MSHALRILTVIAATNLLAACSADSPFVFEEGETRLVLRENDVPVLVFNHRDQSPPDGAKGVPRSGYIHPVFDPEGSPITDDFPDDHPHHRGIFFAWPEMTVFGEAVDFWHLRGIRPSFESLGPVRTSRAAASFESRNIWRFGDDAMPAVREHLRYTVRRSNAGERMIDVHATFTNLTYAPLSIGGKEDARSKGYGGFNIRMDGKRPDVSISTAHGAIRKRVDLLDPPSPWADYSSRPAPDRPISGLAVFQHPSNPGYPFPNWTLRPYGFIGAAWPGHGHHTIEPGESLDLRYRLYIHRGDATDARVAEHFDQFLRETAP